MRGTGEAEWRLARGGPTARLLSPVPSAFWYLKGRPDCVMVPVDGCGEPLVSAVSGVRDHTVGKREGAERDSLGPSVVMKHGNEKGFGEKHRAMSSLRVRGHQGLCVPSWQQAGSREQGEDPSTSESWSRNGTQTSGKRKAHFPLGSPSCRVSPWLCGQRLRAAEKKETKTEWKQPRYEEAEDSRSPGSSRS